MTRPIQYVTPTTPDDEEAARRLATLFQVGGTPAFVHWDRSPWGVRLPLTDDDDEYAPALYVLTENQPVTADLGGRRWFGQLGNFPDEVQDQLYETSFEWLERSWAGDDLLAVMRKVEAILPFLKAGAEKFAEAAR